MKITRPQNALNRFIKAVMKKYPDVEFNISVMEDVSYEKYSKMDNVRSKGGIVKVFLGKVGNNEEEPSVVLAIPEGVVTDSEVVFLEIVSCIKDALYTHFMNCTTKNTENVIDLAQFFLSLIEDDMNDIMDNLVDEENSMDIGKITPSTIVSNYILEQFSYEEKFTV